MKQPFYLGLSIGSLVIAAMLAACGDDSSTSGPDVVEVKNKTISGVSQKGPFVTGSSVKLYELDGSTYVQTGKVFPGKISSDDGKFSVPKVTLSSQYALLEASGYFRNELTGDRSEGVITLNALTDLNNRKDVNINLLTHLEYERVLYLVGTGLSVKKAKKQAETEILSAFGIQGDFANSEDLDIFSEGDGNAALLAISVLMLYEPEDEEDDDDDGEDGTEARLTELLTKFAIDIEKDGKWDDEKTKVEMADWVQEGDRYDIDDARWHMEEWNLGTVPDFEKYVLNFRDVVYGLGNCGTGNEGEVVATKNKSSKTFGTETRFICKNGSWVDAIDTEKDTYKWTAGKDGEIKAGSVTKEKWKFDEKLAQWRKADSLDVSLGKSCTGNREGSTIKDKNGNTYYCASFDNSRVPYDDVLSEVDSYGYRVYKEPYDVHYYWESLTDGWSWYVPKELRFNPKIDYGTMTDSRDKKIYKTVKIGNQVWMAENLNYADSVASPSLKGRSWCPIEAWAETCDISGRVYTWGAAINEGSADCGTGSTLPDTVYGICPPGWHLPSNEEWFTLFTFVAAGELDDELEALDVLKSQTGWGSADDGVDNNGTDAFGFTALPVYTEYVYTEYMYNNGRTGFYDGGTGFWSAEGATKGRCGPILILGNMDHAHSNAYSVRCVQNSK